MTEKAKHTPELVKKKLSEITKDCFLDDEPSNIQINAPRALIQCNGEGKVQGIRWMLSQPLYAAAPELLEAAKIGLEVVKEMIKDVGPCEHDVNICVCGYISYADQIQAAISKAEGR